MTELSNDRSDSLRARSGRPAGVSQVIHGESRIHAPDLGCGS